MGNEYILDIRDISKHFGGIHPAPERSGGIKKPAAFRKFFRIAFAVFNPFCDRPQNQEQQ